MVPANLSHSRRLAEKAATEEFKNAPSASLPSEVFDAINSINLVADKSTNLKGEHRGLLNKGAARIKAAVTALVERYEAPEVDLTRDVEMESLRERLTVQEKEMETLRRERAQIEQARHEERTQNESLQKELRELRSEIERLKSQRAPEERVHPPSTSRSRPAFDREARGLSHRRLPHRRRSRTKI
ncbi:uncharacterized protein LOC112464106 [Temnothorax curvispinosus]|uniref:Uncharacterized protein LOC112464106 n=1 Tax=Temnothorax curvispinosus TaxID=300111 RepID=A0A6J1QXT3_9HYME|nr:uncharacterized protein LOC112464106 [Temnothorax curvispinosus]